MDVGEHVDNFVQDESWEEVHLALYKYGIPMNSNINSNSFNNDIYGK